MKILFTLALVQITGILGAVITEQPIVSENARPDLIEIFRVYLDEINDHAEVDPYIHMTEEARLKCARNGGPKAYDAVIENAQTTFYAVLDIVNTTLLQLESASNEPDNIFHSSVSALCQYATNMNDLGKNFTKSLGLCWTEAERRSTDRIYDVSTAALRHICSNTGSNTSAFLDNDLVQCVASKLENHEIEGCRNSSFTENITYIESFDHTADVPWSVPVIVPTTEICRTFENFQRCTTATLRSCEHSAPSEKINSLFNIVIESAGCKSLLRSKTSLEQ